MNEINREDVRKQVVNMLADLKDLAALYMENNRKVAEMEGNAAYSREYKDAEIQKIREQLEEKVSGTFENLREHFESMVEIMREIDFCSREAVAARDDHGNCGKICRKSSSASCSFRSSERKK